MFALELVTDEPERRRIIIRAFRIAIIPEGWVLGEAEGCMFRTSSERQVVAFGPGWALYQQQPIETLEPRHPSEGTREIVARAAHEMALDERRTSNAASN